MSRSRPTKAPVMVALKHVEAGRTAANVAREQIVNGNNPWLRMALISHSEVLPKSKILEEQIAARA